MREYNERELEDSVHISDEGKKRILQQALQKTSRLHQAEDRDSDRRIEGLAPYSYEQYFNALMEVASRYDGKTMRRSANRMTLSQVDDGEGRDIEMLIQELGRRLPGSTMSRETWKSLTKITQSKWDEIPDKEKKAT